MHPAPYVAGEVLMMPAAPILEHPAVHTERLCMPGTCMMAASRNMISSACAGADHAPTSLNPKMIMTFSDTN